MLNIKHNTWLFRARHAPYVICSYENLNPNNSESFQSWSFVRNPICLVTMTFIWQCVFLNCCLLPNLQVCFPLVKFNMKRSVCDETANRPFFTFLTAVSSRMLITSSNNITYCRGDTDGHYVFWLKPDACFFCVSAKRQSLFNPFSWFHRTEPEEPLIQWQKALRGSGELRKNHKILTMLGFVPLVCKARLRICVNSRPVKRDSLRRQLRSCASVTVISQQTGVTWPQLFTQQRMVSPATIPGITFALTCWASLASFAALPWPSSRAPWPKNFSCVYAFTSIGNTIDSDNKSWRTLLRRVKVQSKFKRTASSWKLTGHFVWRRYQASSKLF